MPKVQKCQIMDVVFHGGWAIVALDWWDIPKQKLMPRHMVVTRERGRQFQREHPEILTGMFNRAADLNVPWKTV